MPGGETLIAHLCYQPRELRFGTSGRRGEVVDLSQLEIFTNVLGEVRFLQSLPVEAGGVTKGDEFYYAHDLRPSSTQIVNGRGGICQAVEAALIEAGMKPVNLGAIPTPALAYYALLHGKGSIMVTGSHIPFDRNGYKLNTSRGELMKSQEAPISSAVGEVRQELYEGEFEASRFDASGMLKRVAGETGTTLSVARDCYIGRYVDFFGAGSLAGWQVVVYQHSAVGRDLLVELLEALGASVKTVGRSEVFVPVDTENIDAEQLAAIDEAVMPVAESGYRIDAVLSTDGDSDRPLLLGWDEGLKKAVFFSGDLLGMITAEYLDADAIVVPISTNDGIDRGALKSKLEPKTRIGSPFVIAGMDAAIQKGRKAVCGWEANGGFLAGSDIIKNGRTLKKLATRDAMLPLLSVLMMSRDKGLKLVDLFKQLPPRKSKSALLKNFSRSIGLKIVRTFSPTRDDIADVVYTGEDLIAKTMEGTRVSFSHEENGWLREVKEKLAGVFSQQAGFGEIQSINYIDGVRITFGTGDVVHVRPSGNADELRIYAVADSEKRAQEICTAGIEEPNGLLRQLAQAVE